MLLRAYSAVLSGRARLADALAVRWFRLGAVDLLVPIGAGIVVWSAADQFGRQAGPVPFWLAWVILAVPAAPVTWFAFGQRGRGNGLAVCLLGQVLALWIVYDLLYISDGRHLYDLEVYLGSAQRWLDGGLPYMTGPLTSWPDGPRNDFFLYPPPLLPFFAVLARLPDAFVSVVWTATMVGCSFAAFRLLGLSRTWSAAMLAFPPVFIGFESGNVASLTFLLFALATRAGGALVVDTLFKIQSGVPMLWLVRERRFRALAVGIAVVAAVVLLTLPLVGLDAWRQWWDGLGYRAASQPNVPALFGYSYSQSLPPVLYAAATVALVGLALAFSGRRGLAALGLVSIFASPALWPHGFAFALPAVFLLERDVAVLVLLGAGSIGRNMWLLFFIGWLAVLAARRDPARRDAARRDPARRSAADGLHPLGSHFGHNPEANRSAPASPARNHG